VGEPVEVRGERDEHLGARQCVSERVVLAVHREVQALGQLRQRARQRQGVAFKRQEPSE
jgi:predicted NUDIX family NTP pyrophosphohydrolase